MSTHRPKLVLTTDDCMDGGDPTLRTGEGERSRKPEPGTEREVRVENTNDLENTNGIILFEMYFFSVSFALSVIKKGSRLAAPSGGLYRDKN